MIINLRAVKNPNLPKFHSSLRVSNSPGFNQGSSYTAAIAGQLDPFVSCGPYMTSVGFLARLKLNTVIYTAYTSIYQRII